MNDFCFLGFSENKSMSLGDSSQEKQVLNLQRWKPHQTLVNTWDEKKDLALWRWRMRGHNAAAATLCILKRIKWHPAKLPSAERHSWRLFATNSTASFCKSLVYEITSKTPKLFFAVFAHGILFESVYCCRPNSWLANCETAQFKDSITINSTLSLVLLILCPSLFSVIWQTAEKQHLPFGESQRSMRFVSTHTHNEHTHPLQQGALKCSH